VLIHQTRFGYHLRVRRLILGLSATNLGKLTNIDPTWIEAIETDSRFLSKLSLAWIPIAPCGVNISDLPGCKC